MMCTIGRFNVEEKLMAEQAGAAFVENFKLGEWLDISKETYRTYHYRDGAKFRIDGPLRLKVKRREDGTDSHRITTRSGRCFYVAPGWMTIEWLAKDGVEYEF